jgi:DeoR/GlpR family transcriptional regulator of sugar metabolism
MISNQRQQKIIHILEDQGEVTVADLVKEFNVSEMTIRRDLDILDNQGLLRRVHGGAVSHRGRSYEPPFLLRTTENLDCKQRIGAAAAALVQNGDSITLDVGTTTLEIARNLHTRQDLTVITPSLQIANELTKHPGIRLIVTGGILRTGELSLVGHLAERIFNEFFVDKLFLGAGAVDVALGVAGLNIEETLG